VLHLGRAKELGDRWPTGLLAAMNLGYGLEQLINHPTDAPAKAIARTALLRLAEAPREVAAELRGLAGAGPIESLYPLLLNLAADLEQAEGLLLFGVA
jgi:hypothetical protein